MFETFITSKSNCNIYLQLKYMLTKKTETLKNSKINTYKLELHFLKYLKWFVFLLHYNYLSKNYVMQETPHIL